MHAPITGFGRREERGRGRRLRAGARCYRHRAARSDLDRRRRVRRGARGLASADRARATRPPSPDASSRPAWRSCSPGSTPRPARSACASRSRIPTRRCARDVRRRRLEGAPRERLVVPQSAVLAAGRASYVFRDLGDGRFRPARVEVGSGAGTTSRSSQVSPKATRSSRRHLPRRCRESTARGPGAVG